MVMNVANAMNAYRQASSGKLAGEAAANDGTSTFSDTLKSFIGDSLDTVKKGEQAAAAGTVGKADMQSVVMAVDKAGLMLEMGIALRDKVVSAYQEILRMQV